MIFLITVAGYTLPYDPGQLVIKALSEANFALLAVFGVDQ
jgi:hypothetical protein